MEPRDVARSYAAGRVALGAAMLVAPRPLGRVWLGRAGGTPAAAVALRALGARDLVIGAIALHTLDDPQVGPRWQHTCAAVDAVDAVATVLARPSLPPFGSALVIAMAAGGAAAGAVVGTALRRASAG